MRVPVETAQRNHSSNESLHGFAVRIDLVLWREVKMVVKMVEESGVNLAAYRYIPAVVENGVETQRA